MHIPDGFLDVKTIVTTTALAAGTLGFALRYTRQQLTARRIPLLGLASAFVFAAQMINFPVLGGTSGHMIGGTLTAVLLGPSAAVVVISSVLIVQCFLFADGGVTALGANILNMAFIGGVGGWLAYWLLCRLSPNKTWRYIAAGVAAWAATVAASIACSAELAASHTAQWLTVFPIMAGVHMLIGIGEALITALVLITVTKVRPELTAGETTTSKTQRGIAFGVYGLIACVGIAVFGAPLASESPDGLDHTAEQLSFSEKATNIAPAPLPDYSVSMISSEKISVAVAGAIGTIAVFALTSGLARLLNKPEYPHTH